MSLTFASLNGDRRERSRFGVSALDSSSFNGPEADLINSRALFGPGLGEREMR